MKLECLKSKCGMCCRQMMIPMYEPDQKKYKHMVKDFKVDHIYVTVLGKCKHLSKDNECKIYDSRPDRCRDYYCWEKKLPVKQGMRFNELVHQNAQRLGVYPGNVINSILEKENKKEEKGGKK